MAFCAHGLRDGRVYKLVGFDDFEHCCDDRLGLSHTTVGALASLQKALSRSPGLQEAKSQKVSRERLRLLARLPEADIKSWIPRAQKLTVIALRRRIEGEKDARRREAAYAKEGTATRRRRMRP